MDERKKKGHLVDNPDVRKPWKWKSDLSKKKILQHVTHACQHTTQHKGFSDCENSLVDNEHFQYEQSSEKTTKIGPFQ